MTKRVKCKKIQKKKQLHSNQLMRSKKNKKNK